MIGEFSAYTTEKGLDGKVSDSSLISSALVATSSVPTSAISSTSPTSICIVCKAPFPTVHTFKGKYTKCPVCYRKQLASSAVSTKPGPIIVTKPTEAQLREARALIAVNDALEESTIPPKAKALIANWSSDDEMDSVSYSQFKGFFAGDVTATSVPSSVKFYFDSGCSFSMVDSLSMLQSNPIKLNKPLVAGGISGSLVYATYVGFLIGFPAPYNVAYYCPGIGVNLYSLGEFSDLGGSYMCCNKVLTLTCGMFCVVLLKTL